MPFDTLRTRGVSGIIKVAAGVQRHRVTDSDACGGQVLAVAESQAAGSGDRRQYASAGVAAYHDVGLAIRDIDVAGRVSCQRRTEARNSAALQAVFTATPPPATVWML
jgi:hypothetical protein